MLVNKRRRRGKQPLGTFLPYKKTKSRFLHFRDEWWNWTSIWWFRKSLGGWFNPNWASGRRDPSCFPWGGDRLSGSQLIEESGRGKLVTSKNLIKIRERKARHILSPKFYPILLFAEIIQLPLSVFSIGPSVMETVSRFKSLRSWGILGSRRDWNTI